MGYKPVRKLYDIGFEDYPGLEVKCTATSLGSLMRIADLKVQLNEQDKKKKMEMFNFFANNLVEWNVEHPEIDMPDEDGNCVTCGLAEGASVPATVKGLMCLDLDFVMTIIFGWVAAISRASAPKGLSLTSGAPNTEDMMTRLGQLQSPLTSPVLS